MSQKDPFIGVVLGGRYRLESPLGVGSMAAVYRAHDERTGATVAVKILHEDLGLQASAVRRFIAEAHHGGRLESRHCVKVLDRGEVNERQPFLVLEFVAGRTLREVLEVDGPLPVERVVQLGLEIGRGLVDAHKKGLVHRDIKPENIMLVPELGEPDYAKILDFGIARETAGAGHGTQVIGTPKYMAPEQWTGATPDARADLYALGCVLYHMVSGRSPFELQRGAVEADERRILQHYHASHMNREPTPLELPTTAPLARLIVELMQKEPHKRPDSATAVVSRLGAMRGIASVGEGGAELVADDATFDDHDAPTQAMLSPGLMSTRLTALEPPPVTVADVELPPVAHLGRPAVDDLLTVPESASPGQQEGEEPATTMMTSPARLKPEPPVSRSGFWVFSVVAAIVVGVLVGLLTA